MEVSVPHSGCSWPLEEEIVEAVPLFCGWTWTDLTKTGSIAV